MEMHQEFGIDSSRKLPTFLIVGAAKSGTTSLADYLNQHPDIHIPENKELRFFVKDSIGKISNEDPLKKIILESSVLDIHDYEKLFDRSEKCLGDASIHYLYHHEECISNIRKIHNYEPKIVIILRNPVERIISNYEYLYDVHKNEFNKELEMENQRKNQNYNSFWFYRELSMYHNQVKAFLDNFNSVHIIIFEEFVKQKESSMNELYDFLGVKHFTPQFTISNRSSKQSEFRKVLNKIGLEKVIKIVLPKSVRIKIKQLFAFALLDMRKVNLEIEERYELGEFFKQDVADLETLIKKDLSIWKNTFMK